MLRFTIRDVLWLMVVVAFGTSWLIDHTKSAQRNRSLQAELQTRQEEIDSLQWTIKYEHLICERQDYAIRFHKFNSNEERQKFAALMKCVEDRGLIVEKDGNGYCAALRTR